MFSFFLFFIFLFFLYFLSKQTVNLVFNILYKLIRHQKLSVYLLAFLFLPGTTIHEVSHFLMATLLHVRTGKISVWPEIEENGHIRAGHVMVAKTDPIRLTVIGIAPMIFGITLIYFIQELFFPQIYRIYSAGSLPLSFDLSTILGFYLIFQITGTFFSSKRDLQAVFFVLPVVVIGILAVYVSRLQVTFDRDVYEKIAQVIGKIDVSLIVGVFIQLALFLFLKGSVFILKPKKRYS